LTRGAKEHKLVFTPELAAIARSVLDPTFPEPMEEERYALPGLNVSLDGVGIPS
jgi:hypothetical protein